MSDLTAGYNGVGRHASDVPRGDQARPGDGRQGPALAEGGGRPGGPGGQAGQQQEQGRQEAQLLRQYTQLCKFLSKRLRDSRLMAPSCVREFYATS